MHKYIGQSQTIEAILFKPVTLSTYNTDSVGIICFNIQYNVHVILI